MSLNINTATPRHIMLGTDDESARIVYPGPAEFPQHLAKIFAYAEKGTLKPIQGNGATIREVFGDKTLDANSKFFTHQSQFAKSLLNAPNQVVFQRVTPTITKTVSGEEKEFDLPNAYSIPSVVVVSEDIPNYDRNSDGSYVLDANGDKVVNADTATISGKKLALVNFTATDENGFLDLFENNTVEAIGAPKLDVPVATKADGTVVNGDVYPLAILSSEAPGEYYNNVGFSIAPLLGDEVAKGLYETGVFGYKLTKYNKSTGTKKIVKANTGDTSILVSFGKNAIDKRTNVKTDIDTQITNKYSNLTDSSIPLQYPEIEVVKIFRDNVKTLANELIALESQYISFPAAPKTWADGVTSDNLSWYDFQGTTAEEIAKEYEAVNILTGEPTTKIPFISLAEFDYTINVVSGIAELTKAVKVNATSTTPIYFSGGIDGDMTDLAKYEKAVVKKLQEYSDYDSAVQDMAINTESIFYDSGFMVENKKAFADVLTYRKDVMVGLSTYVWNEDNKKQSISEALSIAAVLKTLLKLYPESDYFGTGIARGFIVMGSGYMEDGSYSYRVPQTLEVAYKLAQYAGAGNGRWNTAYRFDRIPNSEVKLLTDLDPETIPSSIKTKLWTNGLIYSQPYDRESYHYPAFQTVYENDTSVLNIITVALAICTINKIDNKIWQDFTGATDLTEAELIRDVENAFNESVKGKFDNQYVLVPKCYLTKADEARGYSYRLTVSLYANNMRTVLVSNIEAHRYSELQQA